VVQVAVAGGLFSGADASAESNARPDLPRIQVAALAVPAPSKPVSNPVLAPSSAAIVRQGPSSAAVFGSVAVPIQGTVHEAKWAKLVAENAHRLFVDGCSGAQSACKTELFKKLARLVASVGREPPITKIQKINAAVNVLVRYAPDRPSQGGADHWASFEETVTRGAGDCEDIALVKFWVLQATGVPAEDIHLLLARDTVKDADHAILVVQYAGHKLLLDNLGLHVTEASRVTAYKPLISLGTNGTWIHAVRRAS
jgi:predicted transglutaminase-like cysteine proteinase